jgi:hypothetical protein
MRKNYNTLGGKQINKEGQEVTHIHHRGKAFLVKCSNLEAPLLAIIRIEIFLFNESKRGSKEGTVKSPKQWKNSGKEQETMETPITKILEFPSTYINQTMLLFKLPEN